MMSNTTQKMSVGLVMGRYTSKISILTAKVRISEQKAKLFLLFRTEVP